LALELNEVEFGGVEETYFWFLSCGDGSTTARVEQELQVESEVGVCPTTQPCLGSDLPDQRAPDSDHPSQATNVPACLQAPTHSSLTLYGSLAYNVR
jgi:hypothetical protein